MPLKQEASPQLQGLCSPSPHLICLLLAHGPLAFDDLLPLHPKETCLSLIPGPQITLLTEPRPARKARRTLASTDGSLSHCFHLRFGPKRGENGHPTALIGTSSSLIWPLGVPTLTAAVFALSPRSWIACGKLLRTYWQPLLSLITSKSYRSPGHSTFLVIKFIIFSNRI